MTVIIRTGPYSGQTKKQVIDEFKEFTGGNIRNIVGTFNGVEVPDELAYHWLASKFAPQPQRAPITREPVADIPAEPEVLPVVVAESADSKPKKKRRSKKTSTSSTVTSEEAE